ncbi:MAG: ParB/RepB/Spo0J family partition protein [Candidatus Marinimicrobia bacterium]|nr:ParB/RepB/Spo0J family partition protein [Candidatus Neomarinimicrobiota bacterium]
MANKKLGRGLSALIPDVDEKLTNSNIADIQIDNIKINPYQPRKDFNEEEMRELMDSIKEKGVIQPITVCFKDDHYQLIAGERRYRASKRLNLSSIPAYEIKIDSDEDLMEIALVENIQRENLNPIDEALGYSLLINKYNVKQDIIAKKVGKKRSTITNSLRLLKLPQEIQNSLSSQKITSGHARALLSIENKKKMLNLWQRIIKDSLSVRATEELVKKINSPQKDESYKRPKKSVNYQLIKIENYLKIKFGTRVRIKEKDKEGKIEIYYYSSDDLDRLIKLFENVGGK